eukprot:4922645-Amphidinium_carterae.1
MATRSAFLLRVGRSCVERDTYCSTVTWQPACLCGVGLLLVCTGRYWPEMQMFECHGGLYLSAPFKTPGPSFALFVAAFCKCKSAARSSG